MVWTFLLTLLAGYLTPRADPLLRRGLQAVLGDVFRLTGAEMRVLALLMMLGLAAIGATALGADTSALAAVLGGGLGYYGVRLYTYLRDPDGTDVPEADRWDGSLDRSATLPEGPAGPPADDPDAATIEAVRDALHQTSPRPTTVPAPAATARDAKETSHDPR